MYPSNVLDINQLIKDLADLRASTGKSEKEFADMAGLDWGKIQRIETRLNKNSPPIADLELWLKAAKSNLLIYFGRVAMLDELKVLAEDEEIAEKFKRALKIPAKRTTLKVFLEGLLADVDKQLEKNQSRRPGGRRGAAGDQRK